VIIFGGGKFFTKKLKIVMFFEGGVKGLDVGAPIVFRGVKIGQVTEVFIEANPDEMKTRIPVRGEVYEGSIRIWGDPVDHTPDPEKNIPRLIAKGLRAELQTQSLVTGKLQINMDFFPNTEIRYVDKRKAGEYFEIPTVRSQFEKLQETLGELPIREVFRKISQSLDGLQKIIHDPAIKATMQDIRATVADARNLLKNTDRWIGTVGEDAHVTLGKIQGVVKNVDDRIEPLSDNANAAITAAKQAFQQGEKTLAFKGGKIEKAANSFIKSADAFRETLIAAKPVMVKAEAAIENIRSITGKDSPDRYQINTMLKELSAAARSIRNWAEYLERHPEALLRGKGGPTRR
jgi:paraquat-inducible protein B